MIVGISMAYNFQIGNNEIKLLTKYENVTQKGLLSIESMLHNAKQLQHARPSYVQAVFSVLQYLRSNGFPLSNNSELLFIEGDHRDLVILSLTYLHTFGKLEAAIYILNAWR
jgi:hypothetical protein